LCPLGDLLTELAAERNQVEGVVSRGEGGHAEIKKDAASWTKGGSPGARKGKIKLILMRTRESGGREGGEGRTLGRVWGLGGPIQRKGRYTQDHIEEIKQTKDKELKLNHKG